MQLRAGPGADRARIADTEYLTREVAALRIALGEVATRDFLRSELRDLLEELLDGARPRTSGDRSEPTPRGTERSAAALKSGR